MQCEVFISLWCVQADDTKTVPAVITITSRPISVYEYFPLPVHYFAKELELSRHLWSQKVGEGTADNSPTSMMTQLIDIYLEPWISLSHYYPNAKTASPVTTYASADFDSLEIKLRTNAIRVQIFDGKVVYRDVCNGGKGGAWFKSLRTNKNLQIFKRLAPHLNTSKKIEFFISYLDHPKFSDNSMTPVHNFPYFAQHSTPRAFVDILVPDPVDLSDTYGNSIQTESLPYSERINKVYFRGKFTSFRAVGKELLPSGRVQVHLLSDQYPQLLILDWLVLHQTRLSNGIFLTI